MSLKLERVHRCGYANIDFRSKDDFKNIKLYEPWKIPYEFGTMGRSFYYPSYSQLKRNIAVSEGLNKLKNINIGSPNPKEYAGALIYRKFNMRPRIVQDFSVKKIAELDESKIGKEKYVGDSMMISDIYRYRADRKKKKKDLQDKLSRNKKDKIMSKISEGSKEKEKEEIEKNEKEENKIDIKKVQKIRMALKNRYASRTDYRRIFKDWDIKAEGEINVYSAHDMINRLGIPINFNETRLLISSSNTRGTETLNLAEFLHLIFSDDNILNFDIKNFEIKDEKLFSEGKESEKMKNIMLKNVVDMTKHNDILTIKQQLHSRISIINLLAKNNKINMDKCSKDEFKFLLQKLKFHERYYRYILIDNLYNNYLNEDKESMNMAKLCEECLNLKEENNFSTFKDKSIECFRKKLEIQKKLVDKTVDELKEEKLSRLSLIKDLSKQIEENKIIQNKIKEQEEKNEKEVLSSQPSTKFIDKVYKDHRLMFETLNKVEDSFMSKRVDVIKHKTRYNGNPPRRNTFELISQDIRSSSYINEKERFQKNYDFIDKDREKKRLLELGRLNKIRMFESMRNEACKMREKVYEQKDIAAQNKRTSRQYNYEIINKTRNEFIE